MPHGLDTETQVFFYEQEFYVLSNFSAFQVEWRGVIFMTLEHAYHWMKFRHDENRSDLRYILYRIQKAKSAHDALREAKTNQALIRNDWRLPAPPVGREYRLVVMADLLHAKRTQHEYVARKLKETGDRELVENSWRDGFWGTGEDGKGENWMGRLWMEERERMNKE